MFFILGGINATLTQDLGSGAKSSVLQQRPFKVIALF